MKNSRKFSFLPTAKDEKFSLDGKNCLELAFLFIVDGARKKLQIQIDRNQDLLFDKFITDILIIYFILVMVVSFLLIPASFTPTGALTNKNDNFVMQIYVILLFVSILWGGYVYVTQQFRILIKTKILPVIIQSNRTNAGFYTFLPRIFCGTYYEWSSGFGFRIFFRTIITSLLIISVIAATYLRVFTELIIAIVFTQNFQALLSFLILISNLLIISFIMFILFYALFTVIGIFTYLFLAIRDLPLDINPFIDLGGTEKYGKLILNCLYYVSFAIGVLPFLMLISKFDIKNIHITPDSFQTLGNITSSIRSAVINSLKGVPLTALSENFVFFEMFGFFVLAAIIIIISLHYRIKQRKMEELHRLESMIKNKKLYAPQTANIMERNQYLLSLYDKAKNLDEWPVKRTYILKLIVSVTPLLFSYLFI